MTSWSELVREARDAIGCDFDTREDRARLRDGELDTCDLSHEYADSHGRVIWYSESRALYADGLLDDFEDEARGNLVPESIQDWITAAAYYALRAAYDEAMADYLDEYADEDAGADSLAAV